MENLDIFLEADKETFIIRDEVYTRIEKVLSDATKSKIFINEIAKYINRNSDKLMTTGPIYQTAFTTSDKEVFYDLFSISEKELKDIIKKMVNTINKQANWTLLNNNPIFILFYCTIRYYTIKKDSKSLNSVLMITALAFYPSIFSKYFEFEPNQGIMLYTMDNLSKKFIIKKESHVFGTLAYSIQSSWEFHKEQFKVGSDQYAIAFIQRIRNDQNSLMKKIATQYYDNHKKNLSITTSVDSYDDTLVVDNENNSSKVNALTDKVLMSILINGVDPSLASIASSGAGVSKIELLNYLTKITVDKKKDEIRGFIESIVFLFLYTEKKTLEQVRSKSFLAFCLSIFRKTNANDKNIGNIKKTLDKWGEDVGIYSRFTRKATRVDYTRAIFSYFVMIIQKYS